MTKFDEELFNAIAEERIDHMHKSDTEDLAITKAVALVARKYIIEAWFAGGQYVIDVAEGQKEIDSAKYCREFLKQKGI